MSDDFHIDPSVEGLGTSIRVVAQGTWLAEHGLTEMPPTNAVFWRGEWRTADG